MGSARAKAIEPNLKADAISGSKLAASLMIACLLSLSAPTFGETSAGIEHSSKSGAAKKDSSKMLTGTITSESPYRSLLLDGVTREVPPETPINLTINANLNSEVSQIGNELYARIAVDVKDGETILLPNGWYMRGLVTNVAGQKRLGKDGYVEVEFDKIVSPDGEIELPFKAKLSTKDGTLKAIAKHVAIDSRYLAEGALGGSILSLQFGGIPVAISTYGISVGAGAALGASLGAFGAMHRKGKIASFYPGDTMKLKTEAPITLPGFDLEKLRALARQKSATHVEGFSVHIDKRKFYNDPYDKHSKLLNLAVTARNETGAEYSFIDFGVVSDYNQPYPQTVPSSLASAQQKIKPGTSKSGLLTFSVDGTKRKYYLILHDKSNRSELSRVPIN